MSIGSGKGREEIDTELSEILTRVILLGDSIGWAWKHAALSLQTSQLQPYHSNCAQMHVHIPIHEPDRQFTSHYTYRMTQTGWQVVVGQTHNKLWERERERRAANVWLSNRETQKKKLLTRTNTHKYWQTSRIRIPIRVVLGQ